MDTPDPVDVPQSSTTAVNEDGDTQLEESAAGNGGKVDENTETTEVKESVVKTTSVDGTATSGMHSKKSQNRKGRSTGEMVCGENENNATSELESKATNEKDMTVNKNNIKDKEISDDKQEVQSQPDGELQEKCNKAEKEVSPLEGTDDVCGAEQGPETTNISAEEIEVDQDLGKLGTGPEKNLKKGKDENIVVSQLQSEPIQDEVNVPRTRRGQRANDNRVPWKSPTKSPGPIAKDMPTETLSSVGESQVTSTTKMDTSKISDGTSEDQVVLDGTSECEGISDSSVLNTSMEINSSGSTPLKDHTDNRQRGLYRTYKCKGCKYSTLIKTNLRRHAAINIDYKPYLCNLCQMKFTDKSTFNFHSKKKHNCNESFVYSPDEKKDAALEKYIDMCTDREGKVKSPEGAQRNPVKYKDCCLVTFDTFKHVCSPSSKQSGSKKGKGSYVDNVNDSTECRSKKKLMKSKSGTKLKQLKQKDFEQDGSTASTRKVVSKLPKKDGLGPRRRGPGRKKKVTPGSVVVETAGNPTLIAKGTEAHFLNVSQLDIMPSHSATQASGISLIQTFGGIPIPMQIPMPLPIQLPTHLQAAVKPLNMVTDISQSSIPVSDISSPTQPIRYEDRKKKGRTMTIREILNLDNGMRRAKHFNVNKRTREEHANIHSESELVARVKRGRKRTFKKIMENDQSSTDASLQESEDPSWPKKVVKRRGRPSKASMLTLRGQDSNIGAVVVKRKYMRMKLIGTSSEQYGLKPKTDITKIEDTVMITSRRRTQKKDDEETSFVKEESTSVNMNTSLEKKKVGRKRKIDCVTDATTGGLEKQRKLANDTGLLTEETINISLLALKRRQDNITATGARVKRKYARKTSQLSVSKKYSDNSDTPQTLDDYQSTSSNSSTMEEQRDINEVESSLISTQNNPTPKRGRPPGSKNKTENVKPSLNVKAQHGKRLKTVSPVGKGANDEDSGDRNVVHSGCEQCPSQSTGPDTKKKRIAGSPGRANCLCETGAHRKVEDNVKYPRTNAKKLTLLKSSRMTNYVRKYSQKYSKLAKAKPQGRSSDPQMIKCPLCSYQSKSINGVRLHAFWLHKMCKYTCSDCPFFSLNRHEGLAHYKEEHPGKTVNLVRSSCLLRDVEEDTTSGIKGTIMTLSLDGQMSPSKQTSPCKLNIEAASTPIKSTGAPELTSALNTSPNDVRALKGKCPNCSYISTIRGVGQHLLLAHDMVNWVCKQCKFESQSKAAAIQHIREEHKDAEPTLYKKAIMVKPDPELNCEIPSPKGTSTPKPSKSSELIASVSAVSPTMPKLKKLPKTWEMNLGSPKDHETLQQLIAKPKGKPGKPRIPEVLPAEESGTSYTVHPRKLEALKVGFSCVYCFYAAPLRHQLHLHCYDKHNNHPACLMTFTTDTTFLDLIGDASMLKLYQSGMRDSKKELVTDKVSIYRTIKLGKDEFASEVKSDATVKREMTENGDNCSDTNNETKVINNPDIDKDSTCNTSLKKECGKDGPHSFGVLSVKPYQVTLSHSSTTCVLPNGQKDQVAKPYPQPPLGRAKASRGNLKRFCNPMTPLVAKLGSGQVKLHDTFHSSLDDLDNVLCSFGVRTLNMDMLTRKQFTDFIHRFGNSLQQM